MPTFFLQPEGRPSKALVLDGISQYGEITYGFPTEETDDTLSKSG